ncbi:hypothetical protein J4219_07625 [Candidatus Woesearchaeota archaeon]|nr:hypothetical protein [Candidatus Woesearchaeota archaeon]
MTNHIDLKHSYGNNQQLWVVSPDLVALLNEAPNLAQYNPSPNGFFSLSNDAIYLTCILRESRPERMYLKLKQVMPRFEFSSESIKINDKAIKPVCDSIEIHCGIEGMHSYPNSGISDTVNILPSLNESPPDFSLAKERLDPKEYGLAFAMLDAMASRHKTPDYNIQGKPEWFELGTRLLETAIQKYHVDELYQKYLIALPELKAQQEREDKEKQEKSTPTGIFARLFS